jgi:hypothetical protein
VLEISFSRHKECVTIIAEVAARLRPGLRVPYFRRDGLCNVTHESNVGIIGRVKQLELVNASPRVQALTYLGPKTPRRSSVRPSSAETCRKWLFRVRPVERRMVDASTVLLLRDRAEESYVYRSNPSTSAPDSQSYCLTVGLATLTLATTY